MSRINSNESTSCTIDSNVPSTSKVSETIEPQIRINDPDYLPVAKWRISIIGKYEGSLDVVEFIRKGNHKCKAYKMMNSINCLCKDWTDIWFRSLESEILIWDDLSSSLKSSLYGTNMSIVFTDISSVEQ